MDIVTTIANSLLSMGLKALPQVWQLVLGFLVGCWFYRYLLKRNPARLQSLVDLVNESGNIAQAVVTKVTGAITTAETVVTPTPTPTPTPPSA